MVDSQILKSKLHIFLNSEFFLLLQTNIYLVQLICWVSIEQTVSFLLVFLPSLLFLFPFLVQTLSVTLWLALSITVKTLARCYPCSESEKQRPRSGQLVTWDKTSPVPSPPGPPALTPVSLAQTFPPACPAAPWRHWELISACPQVMSPKPASTIFPSSVNGDPVLPPPHSRHHSLLLQPTPIPSAGLTTLSSKCVWSVTPSLHSHCSLAYSSNVLTCIRPHPSPLTAWFLQSRGVSL